MERGPPAPFSLIILYQGLCLPSNRSLKCPELVMSPLAVRTAHAVLLTWKSLTSPCTFLISACLSDFSYSCTFLGKLSLTSFTWSDLCWVFSQHHLSFFYGCGRLHYIPIPSPSLYHALCHVALQFVPLEYILLTHWSWAWHWFAQASETQVEVREWRYWA